MVDHEEKTENAERIDLLSLPLNERLRMCHEIHDALKAKVSEAKIPLSEDVLIANKNLLELEVEPEPLYEKPSINNPNPNNSLIISNLRKRLW